MKGWKVKNIIVNHKDKNVNLKSMKMLIYREWKGFDRKNETFKDQIKNKLSLRIKGNKSKI